METQRFPRRSRAAFYSSGGYRVNCGHPNRDISRGPAQPPSTAVRKRSALFARGARPGMLCVMVDKVEKIWLDGAFVPWDEAKVHVLTHTLHYGLGVFEGIRCYRRTDG